jgi:hypothetical protein
VSYRTVRGSWREPHTICTRAPDTYSSYWVGLGGYSQTSQALEQIGTEVDCTAGGRVRSTAWYELVPAAAVELRLAVRPGDLMTASVTVKGRTVSLSLYDASRRQGFSKTLSASQIDITSAEWIVEAPSACIGQSACQTLPLANFGTAAFSGASATSNGGHTSGINNPSWQTTKIMLVANGGRFAADNGSGSVIGTATPSAIRADDRSFSVSYSSARAGASNFATAASVRPEDVLRPGP